MGNGILLIEEESSLGCRVLHFNIVCLNEDDLLLLRSEVGKLTGAPRKPVSLQLSKESVQTWHAGLQWNLNEKVVQSQSVKSDHTEAPVMRRAVQWTGIQSLLGGGFF